MIVITGGTGFLGSYLAAELDKRDERIVICDWLGMEDKWRNISKRDIEYLVDPEELFEFLDAYAEEITTIYHLGAISATTEKDGDAIAENNLRLSQSLWLWCADNSASLIYASSAATYGDGKAGFKDEESREALAKFQPLNAYGWSKNQFDRWIARQKERGIAGPSQCVGLKFFNVYGPNEYHKGGMRSVVHQIFPFAQRGEAFKLFKSHHPDYEDGGQLRDFVWVGDCIDVMVWFGDNKSINGLYNMGTGNARSFADLAKAVYVAAGAEPQITFRDMPEELQGKYQYYTQADMTKLRAAGYDKPFTELEEGIRIYVQDFLVKEDPYI